MKNAEQGDILRVSGIPFAVMVVSNYFFCGSGKAIVCPVMPQATAGALHIPVETPQLKGFVLCEQVKYLDLDRHSFSRIGGTGYHTVMDVSDAVMGMFDYQTV